MNEFLIAAVWYSHLLNVVILILGILLILIVLIQRGRGGGLAGAFGGTGGSSAFGSRAGDVFTRITIGMATVWILLIMIHVKVVQANKGSGVSPLSPVGQKSE